MSLPDKNTSQKTPAKTNWQGLPIVVEVGKGGVRSGKKPDGTRWSTVMPCAYGHIPGTVGCDKEEVDVFLGPHKEASAVFAIDQLDPGTGEHDEQKIMLGFDSPEAAAKTYIASFSDGKGEKRLGRMMKLSVPQFKAQIAKLEPKGYADGGSAWASPDLKIVTAPSGARFSVEADKAEKFQAFVNDLEASGYSIKGDQSGGYNARKIAGTNTPSLHSYGRAIDVNWSDNPRGASGNIPPDVARSLANKHGLTWGGDWKNPDPMHFEYADRSRPLSERGLTSVAGLTPPKATPDAADPLAEPSLPDAASAKPVEKGYGQSIGDQILKMVRSWDDDDGGSQSVSRSSSSLRSSPGSLKMAAGAMPYGGSTKDWGGMPWASEAQEETTMAADGGRIENGEPFGELKPYRPGLADMARDGVNAVGRTLGYDDLADRTGETLELLALPSALTPLAGVSAIPRAAALTDAALDASIAKLLARYAPVEQTVSPASIASPQARKAFAQSTARKRGDGDGFVNAMKPENTFRSDGAFARIDLDERIPRPANLNLSGAEKKGGFFDDRQLIDRALYDQKLRRAFDLLPGGKKADGGIVSGALRSPEMGAGGRTDTLPITVKSGAYVFPADVVSALGENNTEQGFRFLEQMFEGAPPSNNYDTEQGNSPGADYESGADHVPIVAAEGEWVASPGRVAWIGGGDLDAGHKILEKFTLKVRQQHINDLKKLPRPHR